MIYVTKPFLPPKGEYDQLINGIWDRNWLTNNGPLVNELELRLKEYLKLDHLLFLTNGTIALQMAIKALNLKGEIITTPFSYVATTSSIVWEGNTPIFSDIDPESFNIDPSKIEKLITDQTVAILATHVYGNPCDIDEIQKIADRYNLRVIYDAAHCFGTTYKGKSVLEFGDISTISFHATKLFHTIEGGAVVTKKPALLKKLAFMRNFGHNGPEEFVEVGINGKNSEFHAAMGLCNLKYADSLLSKRKEQWLLYKAKLSEVNAQKMKCAPQVSYNYAYYPLVLEDEAQLLRVKKVLEDHWILCRRYFYPLLSKLEYIKNPPLVKQAENISKRVLCLPLYHEMTSSEQELVCRLIIRTLKYD